MSVIVAKNNITHPSVGGCFDWVPFIVHHLAPLATNRIGKVAFMPADPANHEFVGTAPALVTQVRQLDQRNVPNLDLDKCRIFETHELIAQGPMPSRQPFAMMQRMLTLC
jgi:hypothetical protein